MSAFLFGPYATWPQKLLSWTSGLVFAIAITTYSFAFGLHWTIWQIMIAALVSFDIPAGAVANNLPSVKQHWQDLRQHGKQWQKTVAKPLIFGSLHLSYIFIMGFLFWHQSWAFGLFMSGLLLLAIVFVTHLPSNSARAGAVSMVALTMVVNIAFQPPTCLWWFMPLLVVKLVSGFSTPATVQ